jgi:hypothetical protein
MNRFGTLIIMVLLWMMVAKEVGGTQCVIVKDNGGKFITIPLDFDGSIMTANLRTPSEEELVALRVIWVLPSTEIITPQSILCLLISDFFPANYPPMHVAQPSLKPSSEAKEKLS